VSAGQPRVRVSLSEQRAVLDRFLLALRTGRLGELMDVMAPDVVLIADGGGIAAAVKVPIHGAAGVAKLLSRAHRVVTAFEPAPVWLDGALAGRFQMDGEPTAISVVVEDGRITRVYVMRTPTKSTRLDEPFELTR